MTDYYDIHTTELVMPRSVGCAPVRGQTPLTATPGEEMMNPIVPILQNLADEARTLIGAHYASIRVTLDPQWENVISAVSHSDQHTSDHALDAQPNGRDHDSLCYPIPRPLRMTQEEMRTHPAWKISGAGGQPLTQRRGLLAVPLTNRQGKNFGLIDLTDKCHGDFNSEDERLLVHLAKIAALALENTWLLQGVPEAPTVPLTIETLAGLTDEIGQTLAERGDASDTLQKCAAIVARHLNDAAVRIWVLQDGALELRGNAGAATDVELPQVRLPLACLKFGPILPTGNCHLSPESFVGPIDAEKDRARREGLTSYAGLPLMVDSEIEGVLAVYDCKPLPTALIDALTAVAQAIAIYVRGHRADGTPSPMASASPPSGHAIITTSLDGQITDWNAAAERLFGYRRRDVIGRMWSLLVPPDRSEEHQDIVSKLGRCQTSFCPDTVRLTQSGQRINVSLTASAIFGPGGLPEGAVYVAHDLVGIKKLEEQLRQAQKMELFGHLTCGVAHDFNNLLTVILGYTELLITRTNPEEPSHDLLAEVHKAGTRAETLTRQLLAFSRKQVLEPRVLDLNAVVSDTEKMLRRLIGEDILMTTIFAPKLWAMRMDPGQLQQVILNLAVNARDAMPKGGRLTIETDNMTIDESYRRTHPNIQPGNYVMLAISDTGVGMSPATKAHIFEPLFTTKGPGKGTGLGLATVHGIVTQSGGHIDVESEIGAGSTFKIFLPQVQDSLSTSKNGSEIHALPRGTETVLLVEDEDCVRSIAKQVLQICGYKVLEARDGEEALRLSEGRAEPIDLLISDVVMPHLGGRSLADRLLTMRPQTKVLFLSGYTNDAVVHHGILDAAYAFLQKPFTTGALAKKVRLVLDQKCL